MRRIRVRDIPRLISILLLIFPAEILSDDEFADSMIWRYAVIIGLSTLSGPMYFYDYAHFQRYIIAIVVCFAVAGSLLLLVFSKLMDAPILLLMAGIFSSFLAGAGVFCGIKAVIDLQRPHPPGEEVEDEYSFQKVLATMGWTLNVSSLLLFTLCGSDVDNVDDTDLVWPDYYYYLLLAVISLLSSLMIAYHLSDRLAYVLALPIGSVISLILASLELKREKDFTPLVVLAGAVGIVTGFGVFLVIKKQLLVRNRDRLSVYEEVGAIPMDRHDLYDEI